MTEYRIGTQGWSYEDWIGPFYPDGTQPAGYLESYAQHFDTVELDTTFYRTPTVPMVRGWYAKTPPGFLFAAKLPRAITHDAGLAGAEGELSDFLRAISLLDDKLGPVLAQLPPQFHRGPDEWVALRRFVEGLPEGFEFAVEFRHRSWLQPDTLELLREHGVAFCIIDLYYMPKQPEVTAGFSYLRLLGDRRKIERVDHVQIDRRPELVRWATTLKQQVAGKVSRVYVYVNNHYAGHSPASVRQLHLLLDDTDGAAAEQPADAPSTQADGSASP